MTASAESKAQAATTVSDDVLTAVFDSPTIDKNKVSEYSEAVKNILARISTEDPSRLHFNKNAEQTIIDRIAEIDRAISKQLSAVMHHPEFQKAEAAWRGLDYLVKKSETGTMLKIKFMQLTRDELADDVVNATRFDQSQLFRKLYEEEFGTAGGKPFGILVGDYEFGPKPRDVTLLEKISESCAAAMCPFIAAASPEMLKLGSFTEIAKWPILGQVFESPEFIDWNNLRDHPDSRYLVLTPPRIMSRLPYGPNTIPVKEFDFREMTMDEKGRNLDMPHEDFAWMSSAFAHAACITRAFAKYGWCSAIRGVEGGGKVEGLPTYVHVDESGALVQKCPSEVSITDRREKELSDLGFIALCHYKQENYSAFIGVWVTSVTNSAAKGTWQYYDSTTDTWNTIQKDMFLRSDAAIRFQPAENFNSETDAGTTGAKGTVTDLKVRLVESTQAKSAYDGTPDLDILCDIANGYIFSATDKTNPDGYLRRDDAARYTNELLLSITVKAVNDGPEISYTGAGTSVSTPIQVNEDADLVFRDGNTIAFSDVDFNERTGGHVTVTLAVGHGTLTLGRTTGLVSVTGNGGDSITLSGSIDAVNAAINGLKYRGDANYNGTDTLTVGISDNGFSSEVGGPATPLTAETTIHIKVDAMNDAPTLTDTGTVTMDPILEDVDSASNNGQSVDTLFGGRFQDLLDNSADSEANAFIGVWVTDVPTDTTTGTWQYYNHVSASWQAIRNDMFLRKDAAIRFQPAENFNSETDAGTAGAKGAVPDLKVRLVESTQPKSDYAGNPDLDILCDIANGYIFSATDKTDADGFLKRDGAARYSNELLLGIAVKAVNDGPGITYTGAGTSASTPIQVNEDADLVFRDGNTIAFSDVDFNERTGGYVTVTLAVGHGTLTLGQTTGLDSVTGNGGDSITLSGSVDAVNAAINGLKYRGDANYNGTDTLTVGISDNGFSSEVGGPATPLTAETTIHIKVDAMNDAPTLTDTGTVTMDPILEDVDSASNNGQSVDTLFGGRFQDLLDNSADSEANAFIGVWVTDVPTDTTTGTWQYFDSTSGTWQNIQKDMFLRSDAAVRFQPANDFNSETDAGTAGAKGTVPELTVRLVESTQPKSDYAGNADLDILCDIDNGHIFTTTDKTDPDGLLNRDGAARYTNELRLGITVKAVNDAPEIAYTGNGKQPANPIPVDEDTNLVLTGGNTIVFSDIDYDERTGGNVTVTLEVADGTLALGPNVASDLIVSGNGGKKVTLTGSIADINAAVDGLTYRGDANFNGTDVIRVNINANGYSSEKGGGEEKLSAEELRIHLRVDAVNDKPTVDGPAAVTVKEDNSLAFTGGNGITVDDPDIADGSGEDALSVVLEVNHGTLSVGNAYTGFVTDNGTGAITIAGTRQQVNDALASLKYQPTENWYGNDSLTIVATDSADGQKGAVETSETRTVAITVTPINDAPVVDAGHNVVAMPDVNEDTPRDDIPGKTINALFGNSFCDPADAAVNPADANSLDGVLVVGANSTGGVWEYNTGSGWKAMPATLSDANGLYLKTGAQVRFVPDADYNGTAPTLLVRLADTSNDTAVNPANTGAPANGATGVNVSGAVGGTTRYSEGTVTLTQKVVAVNDSPVVKDAVNGVAVNDIGKINPDSDIVTNGKTVEDLFGNYFQDVKDAQHNAATNPDGSHQNGFQGILVTEVIGAEYGEWFYSIGGGQETKLALEPGSGLYLPKDAVLRFQPDIDADEDGQYFLTARLVDDSQPVTAGSQVPLPSASDLTDEYSEGVVKIGSSILGENLAPEIVIPDSPTVTERDTTPIRLAPNGTIDDLNLNAIDWRNATLTIGRNGGASAVDVFSSVDTAVLQELREGAALRIDGVTVGVVTKNSGGVLQLAFNDNANKRHVNDVLHNIGYQYNSSVNTTAVSLRYTVNDGNEAENGRQGLGGPLEGSAVQTVVIDPVNEDPLANTDRNHIELSSERAGQASGNVLLNDHDPDGTAVGAVPQVIVGRYGSVVIDANGGYTYTVNPGDVLGLNRGETWTETFRYEMHDSNGGAHQFADLIIDIANNSADNFGSAVEPPPPVQPPSEPQTPEPTPTPPPATPDGTPGDASTPVQNEIGASLESSNQHINEIVDRLGNTTDTVPQYQDVVYDIDRLPWSEDIYLKSRPDSRNIYHNHMQEFTLPDTMFEHSRPGEELTYEAVMADGSPLPEWIFFDKAKKAFSCQPPGDLSGVFEVVVLARDSQNHFAKASLSIMVRPPEELATANGFRDPDQLHRVGGEESSEAGTASEPEVDPENAEGDGDHIDEDTAHLLEQLLEEGTTVEAAEPKGLASDDSFTGRVARVSNTGLWIKSLELVEAAAQS
ncbi:MAG: type VI secretion system contractile sheath large subunit [Planctomycetes bacterium]|nr:type VI secretion system contractile sheath large subunit [Planctomycetota bacterium]